MTPDRAVMDFDHLDEPSAKPSWSFRLDGREWHTRQPDEIPLSMVEDIFGLGRSDGSHPFTGDDPTKPCTRCGDPATTPAHLSAVRTDDFFAAVLVSEEVSDFLAMKSRPGSPLTLRTAQALIRAISEAVIARPTNRSARRAPGSRKTAATSKGASSSRARTRRPSAGAA